MTDLRNYTEEERLAYIDAARRDYEDSEGNTQIDDNARLSLVKEEGVPTGAWVQAWVWVPADAVK
jgi:hypothetical protein